MLNDVVNCPVPSKYSVAFVPNLIPNCVEVVLVFGVARRSATTAAMMFVAEVWEVALRFVSAATGIKAKTASKQKAAIPRASVTSTSENPDGTDSFLIAGKCSHCHRSL